MQTGSYGGFTYTETIQQVFFTTPEEIAGIKDVKKLMEKLGFEKEYIDKNMKLYEEGKNLYLDIVVPKKENVFQRVSWDDIRQRFIEYVKTLELDDLKDFENYYPDMFNRGVLDVEKLEKNYFSAYRTKEASEAGFDSLQYNQQKVFTLELADRFGINKFFTGQEFTATVDQGIMGCSEMVLLNDGANLPIMKGNEAYTTYRFSVDRDCNYKLVGTY